MMRAIFSLLLVAACAPASVRAGVPSHPCLAPKEPANAVAPVAGQPAAVSVVNTPRDLRVWVGDTVTHRCLGYASVQSGSPPRWFVYLPVWGGYAEGKIPGSADGGTTDPVAAVRAILGGTVAAASPAAAAPASAPAAASPAPTSTPAPARQPAVSGASNGRRYGATNDPIARRYVDDFRSNADRLWSLEGSKWEGNYYDRALIYYQAWRRFGNDEYLRRANAIAVAYRRDYLEKNNYVSSPHWAQLEGLAEHYRVTGDEASRTAVLKTAVSLAGFLGTAYMSPARGDQRIAARVLQAMVLAAQLADPRERPMWSTRVDSALAAIVRWQAPDGSYPTHLSCDGQTNFMVGMLNETLIRTYEDYRQDPRIPGLVQRATIYLWDTQWLPDGSFKYNSVSCPRSPVNGEGVGGPTPAPDLNQFFTTSFGWLYRTTNNRVWRDRGEQVFAGGISKAFLSGTKQFNESYTSGFRYLDYR